MIECSSKNEMKLRSVSGIAFAASAGVYLGIFLTLNNYTWLGMMLAPTLLLIAIFTKHWKSGNRDGGAKQIK